MKFIRVKKAFTLIELIIVILITGVTYFLIFSNNSFSLKNTDKKVDLQNLKEFLLQNFSFEKKLSFICIEEDFSCFVKVDNILLKDFEIKHFFKIKPDVYEYNKDERKIEYKELRVNNFNYKVIFELKIDSDYKTNEFILDTLDNKVFVFNSIFTKPIIYNSLDEIFRIFNQKQIEVSDAF